DFLLEEVDAFLALEDDPTSPKIDQSYVDTEGDILHLEAFVTPPKSEQCSRIPLGVLLHSSYIQVTENDIKRDV
nr:hypothetical protein [Tanacetum cinerariifolium]